MLKEFKEFATRGNIMDMAIGVVIGGAFQSIVNSLVNDIIMPAVSILTGKVDFSNIKVERVDFVDCIFTNCDLSNVDFSEKILLRCEFKNCKLVGTKYVEASIQSVVFEECIMKYSNFNNYML